jgi:hypothetical protein
VLVMTLRAGQTRASAIIAAVSSMELSSTTMTSAVAGSASA